MKNKIVQIVVNQLFGFFTHTVKLMPDGVTFIHGPNGCGKTTFLKLISSFIDWDLLTLNEIRFESLEFHYDNNVVLKVDKKFTIKKFEEEKIEIPSLTFELIEEDKIIDTFEVRRGIKEIRMPRSQIEEYLPFLHRIGATTWIDVRTDERLSYNEIVEKFSRRLPFSSPKKRPEWLHNLQESAKLHFVQTQRLLKVSHERRSHREERNVTSVIELYSKEIRERISAKLAESAAVSQSKDRSFPQRLLSLSISQSLPEDKIREDYKKTEEKIGKLMESGLVEQEKNISLPDKVFEATEKKVLSLYLQDINEKFSVFDDLLMRIETFLNIVSTKLRNKTFKVNPRDGFLIETTQGTPQKLRPSELSSGEQHQIVLFYELIFKTSDNSFFLIDEPEISLHIDWQRQFLNDISKIAQLGQHSFLVATHSPQIIGNRRDLAVSLDGGILND